MHGKGQRGSELCRRLIGGQHMPVTTTTTVAVGDSSVVSTITADSFCKGGRKVSVGDCALFKPSHDSPPFIGIIRRLKLSEDNNLQLGVNWLYRPAELKLCKGILPEVAPNEIFYSFHRDETPAASLLHPCKVAFLSKGAELPTGISSFICRRVYDISNECLWWLTDQDYIKELQEEVGQLLNKTRVEMHATVQPGGRSPKPMNGSMSTSQLKPGSDNVQSSVTSFPTHVKGKKRERGDQGPESIKRERSIKTEDIDSSQIKAESILKSEISKITDKGGLLNSEGVEKLVHLMQPDRNEKKMDLISRSMLASVVAATENFDCLTRFVQLRGLPVLDEWLQDVHKGRIGESSNTKDGDKSVEEFLFVLLRALDKLPVNLQALQMCHIGRSVNHLRQHKNTEIQRKARSLVDTWKKRVEAEMNIIDAKSGSNQAATWPSKSRLPEASHSISKNPGGSNDVTKSAVAQLSASRMASIKTSQGETTVKSASLSPGSTKPASSPASGKEGQHRVSVGGSCDVPSAREDKSSSSSQSHNHSQSISGKEDGRSSTAVSMNSIKISTGGSRHRKSNNGYPGSSISGSQKESPAGRSSHRNPTSEKLLQSAVSGEKIMDVPVLEGSGHKLKVKMSNRGRSPAQSASGGSYEDPTNMSSRASSPVLSEKSDQFDRTLKEKTDADRSNLEANAESWQSNDFKDILTGSDDGDGSPAAVTEEERSKIVDDSRRSAEVRAACTSGTEAKSGKLHEASYSPMNALIESCVKYSESNVPMLLGDAIGMNLLASVAAEEMSKSNMVSPSVSPHRNTPAAEEACTGDDAKSKSPPGDITAGDRKNDDGDGNGEELIVASASWSEDKLLSSMGAAIELPGDRKASVSPSQETMAGGCKQFNSPCFDSQTAGEKLEITEKSVEVEKYASSPRTVSEKAIDGEASKQFHEETLVSREVKVEGPLDANLGGDGASVLGDKVASTVASFEDQKPSVEVCTYKFESENKNGMNRVLNIASAETKPSSVVVNSEKMEGSDKEERLANIEASVEDKARVGTDIVTRNQKGEASVERKNVVPVQNSGLLLNQKDRPGFSNAEVQKHGESRELNFSAGEADKTKDCGSANAKISFVSTAAPESASKVKFDLNEGFFSDEGKYGDPINLTGPGCLSNVHIMNPLPFAVSSVSCSLPASITVAAAAKGPFVPPEELLRVKGEFGWKGSAATSAFRPAEPRKSLDMPLSSATISRAEASTGKHSRPQLDIDLNVPDERTFDDINGQDSALELISPLGHSASRASLKNDVIDSPAVRCSGGLDLDLNRLDEPGDAGQCSVSSSCRLDGAVFPSKASTVGLPTGDVRRDFDLNNGPGVDESNAEQSLFHDNHQGSMRSQLPASNLRLNNPEMGNLSSWFTPGSTYSTVTLPSILPDRVEQTPFPIVTPGAQRILGPAGSPFTPDVYRSSVLSSSPAVPFQSSPFQYPVFPFGTSFALPSASFSVGSTSFVDPSSGGRIYTPSVNSPLLGPVGSVSSQYPRPYVVGLPDSNSNGTMDHNRKWGRQGLDLNAGPGVVDMEGREESVSLTSRQLSVAGSQALAEEHGRMYAVSGGVLKRKEPEGGWDSESFRFKQSWH
ncbi:uncharacterized protein LOC107014210 [Solanum pennellii]|uniref:Uncharacterized protein LOC107014210 n=1 Tax=Solanum pennellii TaxID=28526 RepID=A0ABM1GDF6_SOLPN|nr:uncharacterized protein LOC107014210 [Solanum pennellii]XP_015069548.1 uncharacterized protein LOC107014210 [Solanum pennellii]XP_015069549.1 uncharacterized protein LOC107014210 [Solanum pennellii]